MKKLVSEYMTRDITSATEDMTLREVAEMLSMRQLYAIPVVNDFNQVVGYITDKMLVKAVCPERIDTENVMITLDKFTQLIKRTGDIGKLTITQIMEQHPISVTEETLIADVVELILNKGVHSIPVVRNGLLVGTITRASICRFLIGSDKL